MFPVSPHVEVVVRSHSPLNQTFHGIFLGLGYVKCFFAPLQRVTKWRIGVLTERMRKQWCWFRGNSELQRVWWVIWGLAKITQLVFDRHCIECDLCCEAANGSPQAIFDGCDSVGMLHLTLPDCVSGPLVSGWQRSMPPLLTTVSQREPFLLSILFLPHYSQLFSLTLS